MLVREVDWRIGEPGEWLDKKSIELVIIQNRVDYRIPNEWIDNSVQVKMMKVLYEKVGKESDKSDPDNI